MSSKKVPSRTRRAYQFIESHRNEFSVQMMCRLLGVARAGYYAWLDHPVSDRAQEDARLLRLIRSSFTASHGIYGAPRVLQDLRERGEKCSKHRVARLMRENGIQALHGYRIRHIPVAKPRVCRILCKRDFGLQLRQTALELDGKAVQGGLPVADGHRPFLADVA